MEKRVLLIGRMPFEIDLWAKELAIPDVKLYAATHEAEVRALLAAKPVDVAILGAGLALETRLAIVRHIFEVSDSTTVHMKDFASGREGMLAFVKGVLTGLYG